MTVKRANEHEDWLAIFDDLSTRYFDKRFTQEQAWTKARRYDAGLDSWLDGLYKEAIA